MINLDDSFIELQKVYVAERLGVDVGKIAVDFRSFDVNVSVSDDLLTASQNRDFVVTSGGSDFISVYNGNSGFEFDFKSEFGSYYFYVGSIGLLSSILVDGLYLEKIDVNGNSGFFFENLSGVCRSSVRIYALRFRRLA